MDIKKALRITGFVLCMFKADGTDSDSCASCDKIIPKGENIYYERTCYETDEGDYHCEQCVIDKPAEWQSQSDYFEEANK